MFFTIIGAIVRCMQFYSHPGDEIHSTESIVMFIISIVLYVFGIAITLFSQSKSSKAKAFSITMQIIVAIFFLICTPAASFIGKICMKVLALVLGCFIIFVLFGIFRCIGEGVIEDPPIVPEGTKSESSYERWAREEKEREQYVRNNWNSSRGRLNSNATMYETPDGEWLKISRDGKQYEDKNGYWHNL